MLDAAQRNEKRDQELNPLSQDFDDFLYFEIT